MQTLLSLQAYRRGCLIAACRRYATEFKAVTDMGGFECAKPTSIRQSLRQMQEQLSQLSQAGTISWYRPPAQAGISQPFVPGTHNAPAAGAAASGQQAVGTAAAGQQEQQQPQPSPRASQQQQQGAQGSPSASQQRSQQQQQQPAPSPRASQQQQQGAQGSPSAPQQQHTRSSGPRQVFLTPGGNMHTQDDLLGGYTPQVSLMVLVQSL